MNIAYITLGFNPLYLSGLDVSGERLVDGLLAAGHRVTVIAGRKRPFEEARRHPGLRVERVHLNGSDWIGFGARTAARLRRLPPFDVVHFADVHFAWACRVPYVASLQHSFRQRIDSLRWGDGPPGVVLKQRLYYMAARYGFERPAAGRARGLLAGSRTTKREFVRHYGLPEARIAVARQGVPRLHGAGGEGTPVEPDRFGLQPGRPVLVSVGFMTRRKGLEWLARAMPHIDPRPQVLLVGAWRDKRYRERVMKLFARHSVQVCETGYVADDLLAGIYALADVYVSSSLLEGFGLPAAESLACGTPVVATDVGAAAEVVGPGGVLVPPRDPRAFGDAVSALLRDPVHAARLARAGADHVGREFTVEGMVAATLQAYEMWQAH